MTKPGGYKLDHHSGWDGMTKTLMEGDLCKRRTSTATPAYSGEGEHIWRCQSTLWRDEARDALSLVFILMGLEDAFLDEVLQTLVDKVDPELIQGVGPDGSSTSRPQSMVNSMLSKWRMAATTWHV